MRGITTWAAAIGLALAACGTTAATLPGSPTATVVTAPAPATTTTRAAVPAATREGTTTTSAPPVTTSLPPAAPPVGGDPAEAWETAPLGFPATHDVRIAHGPAGYLAVDYDRRGAVVRVSADGRRWRETGVLRGPNGETEVDVAGLAVTAGEFVVVGLPWSPQAETFPTTGALWRSTDGATWDVTALPYLVSAVVATEGGLVLAGTEVSAGGTPVRAVVEVDRDGRRVDVSATRGAFQGADSADGAAAAGPGALVWGRGPRGKATVWVSADLDTWKPGTPPDEDGFHVQDAASFAGSTVAVGPARVWAADDGGWRLLAGPEAFVLDAVSRGFAEFRELTVQDGVLVAAAEVVEKAGMAWCLADPDDCFHPSATALVSADGSAWWRIPLPGEPVGFDEPFEIAAFTVYGKLAVVHELDGAAMLSTLIDANAGVPLDSGAAPDLDVPVAETGTDLEEGVAYGLRIWTHCGLPNIGPYNGTYWVALEVDDLRSAKDQNEFVNGYVERRGERIVFRIGDPETGRVVGTYAADPAAGETFCY